jgi:cysteine-rich repeat protein
MFANSKSHPWRAASLALAVLTILAIAVVLSVAPAHGESQESPIDSAILAKIRAPGDFTPAPAISSPGVSGHDRALIEATNGSVEISTNTATGYASFVRFLDGLTILDSPQAGNSAVAQADAFFIAYGEVFGITNPAAELNYAGLYVDNYGNSHVTYHQVYQGVPVFAGVLKVHLDGSDAITAVNGTFVPDIMLNASPDLSADEAGQIAVDAVAGQSELRISSHDLSAVGSELTVYRTGLIQRVDGKNHLVFEVEVADAAVTIREFVFVDARTGVVVDQISGILTGLDREVSEGSLANVIWVEGDPDPIPAGWAGGSAQQVTDWQNEIDGTRETYNIFASMAGWDSYDNAGATMRVVNNDPGISCPNANWNGVSTNYCSDVTGDDTVAHEWGHAYTDFTNNLIYAWQSGALNESYSDIWGDVVDLLNARMDDTPDVVRPPDYCSSNVAGANYPGNPTIDTVRWLSGESDPAFFGIPAGSGNAIRDLWDPTCFGDPGKVTDPEYWCTSGDGGGVHTNSGVPNHGFALMTDGGTDNGQVVTGIGLTKASHIHWGAQNMLTPGSTFVDHADALEAACTALIGIDLPALSTSNPSPGPSGEIITAADCQEVSDTIAAVEFRTPPDQCGFEPAWTEVPPLCEGQGTGVVLTIEYQDWEAGQGSWITGTHDIANPASFDNPDWVIRGNLPDRTDNAMYVEDSINRGACTPDNTVAGALNLDSPEITIPADALVPRVAIDHYVSVESGWDGGNLKVSVNGAPWVVVPDTAMEYNGYFPPGAINGGGNDNPLGGEEGWTGGGEGSAATGWGQTQVNLSGFAGPGDTVVLRFDMGLDGCFGVDGWYVDEVEVYSCEAEVAGVCGDGILDPAETCDDGNTANGDGCSDVCQVEDGWVCTDPIPPGPGSNIVDDGSFEAGPFGGIWTESSTNFGTPICDVGSCGTGTGTGPSDGLYWTWFGGIGAYEEGSVSQSVNIPSTANDMTFDLEQIACDSGSDYMEMLVDGNQEFLTDGNSQLCGSLGYTEQTVDLSAYADDSAHTLEFHSEIFAVNAGGSNFFLDDILFSDNQGSGGTPSVCRPIVTDIVCNGEVVDFEGGIPSSWSTSFINNVYWTDTDDLDGCSKGNMTPGTGVAACADSDATNGAGDPYDAVLTSNPFDLTGAESATLGFAASYNDIGTADLFEVDVWDGAAWNNELSWNEDHWDPGEIVVLDLSAYGGIPDVMVRYSYSGDGWDWWAEVDDVSLTCEITDISLEKTVGLDPATCATTDSITVPAGGGGTTVYYCYEATNSGTVTMTNHSLVDSELGPLVVDLPYPLGPGEVVNNVDLGLTISTTITATTVNTATWTAADPTGFQVSASATATVTVLPPTGVLMTTFDEAMQWSMAPVWLVGALLLLLAGAALTLRRKLIR